MNRAAPTPHRPGALVPRRGRRKPPWSARPSRLDPSSQAGGCASKPAAREIWARTRAADARCVGQASASMSKASAAWIEATRSRGNDEELDHPRSGSPTEGARVPLGVGARAWAIGPTASRIARRASAGGAAPADASREAKRTQSASSNTASVSIERSSSPRRRAIVSPSRARTAWADASSGVPVFSSVLARNSAAASRSPRLADRLAASLASASPVGRVALLRAAASRRSVVIRARIAG
jgi:hypothetical protein